MLVWAVSRGGAGSLVIGAVHPAHCAALLLFCVLRNIGVSQGAYVMLV